MGVVLVMREPDEAVVVDDHYRYQWARAGQFAKLSGLPFDYLYTGGGHDAIYGETDTHRIGITNECGYLPDVYECHTVGVYSVADDELLGEIFSKDRAELLATISRLNIGSLNDLVDHVLERGRFATDEMGA